MSNKVTGNYTYDPTAITVLGKDKMRFELGDTVLDGGPMTSPLCDEEYEAIIGSTKSWKKAKLELLKAIVMKLSYEVNTSMDGLSYSLSDRSNRWREMYKELKKELETPAIPTGNMNAIYGIDEPHYFRTDLHANADKY